MSDRSRLVEAMLGPSAETTYGPFGESYQVEQWQPPGGIDPLAMLPVARFGTLGRVAVGLAGGVAAQHGGIRAAESFNPIGAIKDDFALAAELWRARKADAGERYRVEQLAKARLNQRYGPLDLFGGELRRMERAKEYGSAGY